MGKNSGLILFFHFLQTNGLSGSKLLIQIRQNSLDPQLYKSWMCKKLVRLWASVTTNIICVYSEPVRRSSCLTRAWGPWWSSIWRRPGRSASTRYSTRDSATCYSRHIVTVDISQCCGAGAGIFWMSRIRLKVSGSRLLLCDLGDLRWQSCDNTYNFSPILTISYTNWKKK